GGDSIRSIRVKSLAQETGLVFSLQDIFQYQTVAELARAIDITRSIDTRPSLRPPYSLISHEDWLKLPADIEDAYPLTRLQMGLVFHSEHSSDYETYVTSLHVHAVLRLDVLQRVVDKLADRHSMLRTTFDLVN